MQRNLLCLEGCLWICVKGTRRLVQALRERQYLLNVDLSARPLYSQVFGRGTVSSVGDVEVSKDVGVIVGYKWLVNYSDLVFEAIGVEAGLPMIFIHHVCLAATS